MYLESTTKRILDIACLGKSKCFIRKFAIISNKITIMNSENLSFS